VVARNRLRKDPDAGPVWPGAVGERPGRRAPQADRAA